MPLPSGTPRTNGEAPYQPAHGQLDSFWLYCQANSFSILLTERFLQEQLALRSTALPFVLARICFIRSRYTSLTLSVVVSTLISWYLLSIIRQSFCRKIWFIETPEYEDIITLACLQNTVTSKT